MPMHARIGSMRESRQFLYMVEFVSDRSAKGGRRAGVGRWTQGALQITPGCLWGARGHPLFMQPGGYGITPAAPPPGDSSGPRFGSEEAIGHCGWHWPQYPAWVTACLLWVPRSRQSVLGSGRSLRVVPLVIYGLKGGLLARRWADVIRLRPTLLLGKRQPARGR